MLMSTKAITPEQKKRLKKSERIRRGKRKAAIALDQAIAHAMSKDKD